MRGNVAGGRARESRSASWGLAPLLALALAGCANVAEPPEIGIGLASTDPPAGPAKMVEPPGPTPRDFTQDELYKLLVAEFAAKRGDLPLAISNYLEIARTGRDKGAAERAVRLAIYARDEAHSLEAARLWTEIAPDDEEGRQVYGSLLMRAGRLAEALEQFEFLVSADDQTSERGFDLMSELLSRERNKDAALEAMGKLIAGHENNPHALFAYARLAARAGRYDKAMELLERMLAIEPENEAASIFYARLLHQRGDVSGALDSLGRALEKNPDSQALRMTYARLLVDAKRYDEARQQFEKLAEREPDNADVRYALGLLLLQTNHPEAARPHFERLSAEPDRREVANFYLGQIAESLKDYQGALEAYRKVDRGEHHLNAQIRVAVILAEQGAIDDARGHLHALPRESAQEDIRIYRAEAEILSRNDEFEDAMRVYNAALEEHEGDPDLLYARAMLAERLDRLDILERDLRTILAEEPDNADALNALGFTLADRTDRYDEALSLITRALELKPDDYYIIDSMGWVLYRIGRHKEALEYLRRALSLSDDPEVAAHLGEVLWVTGDKKGAKEVWDTALKTTPDDEHLLEVIQRFTD